MVNTPFQNRRNLANVKDVCLGIHVETTQDLMRLIATQVLDLDVAKVWEFNLLVEALGVAYHYGLVHGRAEGENAAAVTAGRMACSTPNVQSVPK